MRITYLSCDIGVPVFGTKGASVHVQELTRALRQLGHKVRVVSPGSGTQAELSSSDEYHFVPFSGFAGDVARLSRTEDLGVNAHLTTEWSRILYSEFIQRALLHDMEAFEPDFIYERYSLFAYAGVELAKQLGVPLVLEVNAPLSMEAARYRQLILRRTAEEMEQKILSSADAVVVVSSKLADYVEGLGVPANRIAVVPNGVDPERFDPAVSTGDVRSRLNLLEKQVIGFAGNVRSWHDLDTLGRAFQLLVNSDAPVHLLFVGEGPESSHLGRFGGDRTTSVSSVRHEDIPQYLAAMDVVVIPYAHEVETYFSPMKLFEAMAMGRPIVAARVGQLAEVLVHRTNGLLYAPNDERDLAAKISEAVQIPDGGARMGAAARQAVLNGHTWDRNARRIVDIARSLKATTRASVGG